MPTVIERHRSQGKIYAVDSIGKPLTAQMAQALREGVLANAHKRALPHLIARGLAQQPNTPYVPPRSFTDPWPLTPEGVRVRDALGTVPDGYIENQTWGNRIVRREYGIAYCSRCCAFVDARLIAWGNSSTTCVNCLEDNRE